MCVFYAACILKKFYVYYEKCVKYYFNRESLQFRKRLLNRKHHFHTCTTSNITLIENHIKQLQNKKCRLLFKFKFKKTVFNLFLSIDSNNENGVKNRGKGVENLEKGGKNRV